MYEHWWGVNGEGKTVGHVRGMRQNIKDMNHLKGKTARKTVIAFSLSVNFHWKLSNSLDKLEGSIPPHRTSLQATLCSWLLYSRTQHKTNKTSNRKNGSELTTIPGGFSEMFWIKSNLDDDAVRWCCAFNVIFYRDKSLLHLEQHQGSG